MTKRFEKRKCLTGQTGVPDEDSMRTINRRSFLGTSAALLPSLLLAAENGGLDAVFYNGNILTVDAGFRRVEAFAVLRDRIAVVGSSAEMLALAGNKTRKIDLQGKTVLPGIIDTHAYPVMAAMYELRFVRPGICHGNFMFPGAWDAIKSIDAVIDMQPAWLYLDGATLFDHFGEKRMKWFQPYRTLLDNKVRIGGGSDHIFKIEPERAINLYNPFLGIWTVLARSPRWTDRILTPEQKMNREEAIRFYTLDSAYVLRCEKKRGSLEPGKLADFIVIDRDILRCPIDDVRETKVLETWLGGKKIAF